MADTPQDQVETGDRLSQAELAQAVKELAVLHMQLASGVLSLIRALGSDLTSKPDVQTAATDVMDSFHEAGALARRILRMPDVG